ncbi:MAG: hypothetical protein UV88_C0005G0021 [Parcubacteria group bacterium GW2011_GWA1_43_21]|nr:MAG: hypothetical protein UV50_C0006G0021 [Parcubacteria group bacterium GW2011_GWB1_42_9]KKT09744.1 MAG: hypothetical protein UV88_C0005G0021 [Parcubacteria group bacterium GW2011_GWA1_43_21]
MDELWLRPPRNPAEMRGSDVLDKLFKIVIDFLKHLF